MLAVCLWVITVCIDAYAGQFVFDEELLASTYPDFYSLCNIDTSCGNTCCVPVGTNGTARVATGG
jgi:hypothetical protein